MKLFNKIFCLVSLAVTVSACNNDQLSESPLDEYFAISKITINETKNSIDNENIILKKNSKVELSCIVTPDNASDKSVLWTSSDETVATVSIDGVVEAKDIEGSAVISATPAIGFGATDAMTAVKVQVVDNYIDIEDFIVTSESGENEMFMSESLQLIATVTNQDATFKRFTWKSSNDEIATVDDKGLVTAIAEGNVTITVTTDDFRSEPISKDFNIKIEKAILLKDLTFTDDSELSALGYGQAYKIQYNTNPPDATRSLISWESSNPDVISVDNQGIVKVNTITEGSVTITAKTTKADGSELKKTVTAMVAKGRFDYSFANSLLPWYLDSGQPGTVGESDGYKTIINMGLKSNKYRADLQFVNGKEFYLDAVNYPIFAVKIALPDYIDNGNLTFEVLDANKQGGSYRNGSDKYSILSGDATPGEAECIYFDLTQNFGKDFYLPTNDVFKANKLTFKIADFVSPSKTSYDVYWVKTFSSVEELKSYVDSENNN